MQETKSSFFKVKKKYLSFIKKQENFGEKFYDKIGQFKTIYLPICDLIYKTYLSKNKTIVVGLSGAQGIKTANPQHMDKINCGYLNHLLAEG